MTVTNLIAKAKATGKSSTAKMISTAWVSSTCSVPNLAIYRLPENPAIPASIFLWKDVIKPLGIFGFWGAVGAALLHYVTVGPKRLDEEEPQGKGGE